MTTDFTIIFDEYMPLKELVFTTLKKAIIKGELQPGDRLMELQLAEKMGVSRTPIREAIHKLSREGLVTLIPRKGAEVAGMSRKTLNDVLTVRKDLEILAFRLAFESISNEQMEDLSRRMSAFEEAVDEDDILKMVDADEQFHSVIYEAAANNKLRDILNDLKESMYRYRLEYLKDSAYRKRLEKEHRALVDSILKKDLKKGLSVAESHIENQKKAVLGRIDQDGSEKKREVFYER